MRERIEAVMERSAGVMEALRRSEVVLAGIEKAVETIVRSLSTGGTLFLCGNGGSAADAQHIAAEFTNRFLLERNPYRAMSLTTDTSFLTSHANDYAWETVFSRQLEALGRPGDVLWGLSTSGNSVNVVRAFEMARTRGIATLAMTGQGGGKMKPMADILIAVDTKETPRVQEAHVLIYHLICELCEARLAGKA